MQIETTRFGVIHVDEAHVLTFPDGIPGFEDCHCFVTLPHSRTGNTPFEWMQSVEKGDLAFLVMRPEHIFPHYQPRISESDLQSVGLEKGMASPILYTLLTVPKGDPRGITANLLAPVLVNPVNRRARQIIVNDDEYGLRHRLLPERP